MKPEVQLGVELFKFIYSAVKGKLLYLDETEVTGDFIRWGMLQYLNDGKHKHDEIVFYVLFVVYIMLNELLINKTKDNDIYKISHKDLIEIYTHVLDDNEFIGQLIQLAFRKKYGKQYDKYAWNMILEIDWRHIYVKDKNGIKIDDIEDKEIIITLDLPKKISLSEIFGRLIEDEQKEWRIIDIHNYVLFWGFYKHSNDVEKNKNRDNIMIFITWYFKKLVGNIELNIIRRKLIELKYERDSFIYVKHTKNVFDFVKSVLNISDDRYVYNWFIENFYEEIIRMFKNYSSRGSENPFLKKANVKYFIDKMFPFVQFKMFD